MDMTRISACTYPLRASPLEHALGTLREAGFERVDLLGRMPHFSADPAECDPGQVQGLVERHGLRVANLGTYVGAGFAGEDPAARAAELALMQRTIDLAVFFGARSIRVRAGSDDPACIDRIVPWFQRSAEYAAARGVYLGFETHGGAISGNPAVSAELCRRVGSPHFGWLYDPCNLWIAGTDYRTALETMREYIAHVHLKDAGLVDGQRRLVPVGQGEIDFRWVVSRLDALGYQGTFAAEYELATEPPETGLRAWRDYFAGL